MRDPIIRWEKLRSSYFPVHRDGEIWSYSANDFTLLPSQGWKLHVSATFVSAPDVLAAVCEVLDHERLSCKTLHDPRDLVRLNAGMEFGYSQIGKFITLYPANSEECVRLARSLAAATAGFPGPAVPFERRVSPDSPVFARYGLFIGREEKLLAPDGQRVTDSREANPSWAVPPVGLFDQEEEKLVGPLGTRYVVYDAIVQRGKGGVYLAIDLATGPRKCVLKEGRRFGEVDGKGVDGQSRVGDEYLNLLTLRSLGIRVPQVYDYFRQGGNSYVVLEFIKGELLSDVMSRDRGSSGLSTSARQLSLQVSELVAAIHAAGFVWRDLKATNVILTPDGEVRPIDFEGSCVNGTAIQTLWGSRGHVPAEWATSRRAEFSHDLFALGVIIRQLHVSPHVQSQRDDPLFGLAGPVREIVAKLTSTNAEERPPAALVADALRD